MIRGTTAQFRFKIPYKKQELEWATMKFWQPGHTDELGNPLVITKRKLHCSAPEDSYELCVKLDADETFKFTDKIKAIAQLRAKTVDGITFASHQQLITVYPINDDIFNDNIFDDDVELPEEENGFIILDGKPII